MLDLNTINKEIAKIIQHGNNFEDCQKLAILVVCRGAFKDTTPTTVTYNSRTEFAQLISDKTFDDILPVMDELMEAVKVLNPRLYDGVVGKLQ